MVGVVEVLLPVERRRAVVGEHLARELLADALGELLGASARSGVLVSHQSRSA
jgi:hypothetical protein